VNVFDVACGLNMVEKLVQLFGSPDLYQTTLDFLVAVLLNVMANGKFLSQVPKYIRMGCKSRNQFECLIYLFEKLKFHLPEQPLPLTDLEKCLMSFRGEEYQQLLAKVRELQEIQDLIERGGVHPMRENTAAGTAAVDNEADLPNFRAISIVPRSDDLLGPRDPHLRKNEVRSPWPSGGLYLDTHFRLSREDFVAGLRKGIHEFLRTDTVRHRNEEVYIYQHVRGVGAAFSERGSSRPFIWLHFSIPNVKANKVQWEYSKRFLNESLLCLSPEGSKTPFTNCIFATVAESSPEDLKQGRVGVRFVDTDQQKQFDWDTQYVMIESTCFFGAVAPVLAALQAKTEIPFGQILLNGQLDNRPPAYI